MPAASKGRPTAPVDGLLLLNKPAGLTSNAALQKVKRLLRARKAGHTGSLDPAATGMLPLCFGEATKICAYLLDADKVYRVVARLGEATDTGDADGRVIDSAAVPDLDVDAWRRVIEGFVGEIEQIPPMYSALKKDGRRLYELARQGETVERAPRPVTIHGITVLEACGRRLVFRVHCSKGTYIRTLVEDIARAAGTVAFTASLHRERVGDFLAEHMLDLADVERLSGDASQGLAAALLPVDSALDAWDQAVVSVDDSTRFLNGQRVSSTPAPAGLVRVYGPRSRFLGIAERDARGGLSPRRVFHLSE
jgi:tRNA pseudouridine55 synthase